MSRRLELLFTVRVKRIRLMIWCVALAFRRRNLLRRRVRTRLGKGPLVRRRIRLCIIRVVLIRLRMTRIMITLIPFMVICRLTFSIGMMNCLRRLRLICFILLSGRVMIILYRLMTCDPFWSVRPY